MKKLSLLTRFLVLTMVISLSLAITSVTAGDIPEQLQKLKPADFPRKPLELVVVYPAGGGMDVTARVLAKHLPKYVGTKCLVVNKTGANGLIGHAYLAQTAPKDGYTVGVVANTMIYDDLLRAEGKWSYTDLRPLAYITFTPITWIVKTDSKFGNFTLKELVDYAKQNPGEIKAAMTAASFFEYLISKVEMTTGAKFTMVPFQGGAPGVTALLGGHVDFTGAFLGEFKSHLEAGTVKPLATSGIDRFVYLPDVPTFNEALGVNDIFFGVYRYVAVPKGTPEDRAVFLEAAVQAALRDPEVIKDFEATGVAISKYLDGPATGKELEQQYDMIKQVLTALGKLK
jgi:tripartite-type tricarboxylate transporter receptor subunit TctC